MTDGVREFCFMDSGSCWMECWLCLSGLESLKERLGRSLCEAVKMKPKMLWRQDGIEDARSVGSGSTPEWMCIIWCGHIIHKEHQCLRPLVEAQTEEAKPSFGPYVVIDIVCRKYNAFFFLFTARRLLPCEVAPTKESSASLLVQRYAASLPPCCI